MNEDIPVLTALIRTAVFVNASRRWKDPRNMPVDGPVLKGLAIWCQEQPNLAQFLTTQEGLDSYITQTSSGFRKTLKTDWNIATALLVNSIASLDEQSKSTVSKMVDDTVTSGMRDSEGVQKAMLTLKKVI